MGYEKGICIGCRFYEAANAIATTRIYNDECDSDAITATNAFTREMNGNNLKGSSDDATMNWAAGFAVSWPAAHSAEDTVIPVKLKTILDDNNYSTKEDTPLFTMRT